MTKYPPMAGWLRGQPGSAEPDEVFMILTAGPVLKCAQTCVSSSLAELPSKAGWAGFLLRKSSQQGQPADKLKLT